MNAVYNEDDKSFPIEVTKIKTEKKETEKEETKDSADESKETEVTVNE